MERPTCTSYKTAWVQFLHLVHSQFSLNTKCMHETGWIIGTLYVQLSRIPNFQFKRERHIPSTEWKWPSSITRVGSKCSRKRRGQKIQVSVFDAKLANAALMATSTSLDQVVHFTHDIFPTQMFVLANGRNPKSKQTHSYFITSNRFLSHWILCEYKETLRCKVALLHSVNPVKYWIAQQKSYIQQLNCLSYIKKTKNAMDIPPA